MERAREREEGLTENEKALLFDRELLRLRRLRQTGKKEQARRLLAQLESRAREVWE
jgi:hypothetical protein